VNASSTESLEGVLSHRRVPALPLPEQCVKIAGDQIEFAADILCGIFFVN
jgi:hypothetical protein